jgi:hypothetical protein
MAESAPLSAAARLKLAEASRSAVIAALNNISLSSGARWLDPTNVYSAHAGRRIRSDKTIPPAQVSQFVEYLASGVFVHCGDAWSYFGRAVDALLRGDLQAAIHLTYYSELRAGISLLASEGISIGDRFNFVVKNSSTVDFVTNDATHQAAWQYLSAWNESAKAEDLLARIMRPGNAPFSDWASAVSTGGVGPVVQALLAQMKLDLKTFSGDRDRRNAASYNPTRMVVSDLAAQRGADLAAELWGSLEPAAAGTFPLIDDALVAEILRQSFASTHGEPYSPGDWHEWLDASIPSSQVGTALHLDLRRNEPNAGDRPMAALFETDSEEMDETLFVAGMMHRAVVLLRIASGSAILLLQESNLAPKDIFPWVDSLATARGIWPVGDPIEDRLDLWGDTRESLEVLTSRKFDDSRDLLDTLGSEIIVLGQAERVVAWNF